MASRATIRGWIRNLLGTTSDDPFFKASTLDPIIQQACDALVTAISEENPDYLVKPPVTLTAQSATSHSYDFAQLQITDFAKVLELRYTDEDGAELMEARLEELRDAGADYYAITGDDEHAVLQTSKATEAGTALWMRYRYWPADMDDDADSPEGIPTKFHDVVALEALFAFGLGGEQRLPPELHARWIDRRAQLFQHVKSRSTVPRRTRLLQ